MNYESLVKQWPAPADSQNNGSRLSITGVARWPGTPNDFPNMIHKTMGEEDEENSEQKHEAICTGAPSNCSWRPCCRRLSAHLVYWKRRLDLSRLRHEKRD